MTPNFDSTFRANEKFQDDATRAHHQASTNLYEEVHLGQRAAAVLKRDFDSIDSNDDGLVSKREVSSFKKQNDEQDEYRYLNTKFKDIAELNDNQLFSETKISRFDVEQFRFKESKNLSALQRRYHDYEKLFNKDFENLDINKNGYVSKNELVVGVHNSREGSADNKAFKFFYQNFDEINNGFGQMESDVGLDQTSVKRTGEALEVDYSTGPSTLTATLAGGAAAGLMLLRWGNMFNWSPSLKLLAVVAGTGALVSGVLANMSNRQEKKYVPACQSKLFDALNDELNPKPRNYYELTENSSNSRDSTSSYRFTPYKSPKTRSEARSILENL